MPADDAATPVPLPPRRRIAPTPADLGPLADDFAGALGPNPVECGTPGAPLPVLTDTAGLPRAVAVSTAHTHDSLALIPLVQVIPALRSARGPRRRRPAKSVFHNL